MILDLLESFDQGFYVFFPNPKYLGDMSVRYQKFSLSFFF